jgi:hypothetical protein
MPPATHHHPSRPSCHSCDQRPAFHKPQSWSSKNLPSLWKTGPCQSPCDSCQSPCGPCHPPCQSPCPPPGRAAHAGCARTIAAVAATVAARTRRLVVLIFESSLQKSALGGARRSNSSKPVFGLKRIWMSVQLQSGGHAIAVVRAFAARDSAFVRAHDGARRQQPLDPLRTDEKPSAREGLSRLSLTTSVVTRAAQESELKVEPALMRTLDARLR